MKFYLPKFDKYFVHLFSSEEGFTEFSTLPKALKEVNHWKLSGNPTTVDFSRLCKDRFWLGREGVSKVQLLTDVAIWTRSEKTIEPVLPSKEDWTQCTECSYLIDSDETSIACKYCHSPYHSDCLISYEKKTGPEYSPELLDKQAERYSAALQKWRARKTSKNPSLVLEDENEGDCCKMEVDDNEVNFVCFKCRDCRYCARPCQEEIIPSAPGLPSVEPWVVCKKCNSVAHGHCVFPSVPKLHASVEYECDDCRECNSCGRVTYLEERKKVSSKEIEEFVSPLTDWALPSFEQCKACWAGIDRGEYCPVCMKAWTTEWGGNMIQCDTCAFWVHTECDSLDSELRSLSVSSVKYNCPICRDSTDIFRRRRVIDLLRTIDKIALFSEPVSAAFLPTYLKVIKQPMDLQKMKSRNEMNGYSSNLEFIEDFELIVVNAKNFNMPNSAAYRLAEQFHKQGKLLVEKYLLVDKKGACKIEEQQTAKIVKKINTYENVLEMMRRKKIKKPSILVDETAAGSGLISPYRRKLLKPIVSGQSPMTDTPAGSPMKEENQKNEISVDLKNLFGFTDNFFFDNGNTLYSKVGKRHILLPAKFDTILAKPYTSSWTLEDRAQLSLELGNETRFVLYDCCTVCKSFGEGWNLVDCVDCGEAVHWYCAGLVAPPKESLGETALGSFRSHFKCVHCRPVGRERCAMCGQGGSLEFQLSSESPICASCALSQAFHFFKTPTCWGCETPINPNSASLYLQALPNPVSAEQEVLSNRTSPLVHCVVCGHTWHTRCLPEFADIASTDVLGIYTCSSCCSPKCERGVCDEVLGEIGNHLRNFKSRAYREIQLDLLVETLRSFGLGFPVSDPQLVNEVLEMFSVSGTCLADCVVAAPTDGAVSKNEADWIEWGLLHKEFLIGLGNPLIESKRRNSSEVLLPNGTVSVRIKRIEDEDLLLAKRLYVVFQLVFKGGSGSAMDQPASFAHLGPYTLGNFAGKSILGDSELGASLLAYWYSEHETKLYTGLGVSKMPQGDSPLPSWDSRRCALCTHRGDQLVFGNLLGYGDRFVHSECLAWSLPRLQASDFTQEVNWKYAMPVAREIKTPETPSQAEEKRILYTEEEVLEVVAAATEHKCLVCSKSGASVHCQQCQGTWFHLGCALRANNAGKGLLMDSRCRLLTCEFCLSKTPGARAYFVSQFRATSLKSSQCVIQQLFAQRHQSPIGIVPSDVSGDDLSGVVAREGSLAIIKPGSFVGEYTGSSGVDVCGFVSTRLFWTVDYALRTADDEFMQSVIGKSAANNKGDLPMLKKKRKTVYVNKISEDGKLFSIEIIGGRIVAIGNNLEQVWSEFKFMTKSDMSSGSWFFGLESEFMRNHLNQLVLSSIRKTAGINREGWIYQPELRAKVTEVLNMANELKPVRSWRKELFSNKGRIDQLQSLGREAVRESVSKELFETLLEPALVILEKATMEGRVKTSLATDASNSAKYKSRSLVADLDVLAVKRSQIHNYGLFAKLGFGKGDMVVEYQGEVLRQTIADEREKRAEREGNGDGGSCYMFKLDDDYVVDATVKGNCARFINHSCNPNCTCKMVEDEQHRKHIMIVAKRDITQGEEITYDYQFAVESEKLACLCGAPNCLGRLN